MSSRRAELLALFVMDSVGRFRRGWIAALAGLHVTAVGTVLFENGEDQKAIRSPSGSSSMTTTRRRLRFA